MAGCCRSRGVRSYRLVDLSCAGVDGVLGEFLDDGGGSFDDLAGGDLRGDVRRKDSDVHGVAFFSANRLCRAIYGMVNLRDNGIMRGPQNGFFSGRPASWLAVVLLPQRHRVFVRLTLPGACANFAAEPSAVFEHRGGDGERRVRPFLFSRG